MTKSDIGKSLKELAAAVKGEGLETEKWLREEYLHKKLRNADEKEQLKRVILCAGEWSLRGANKREEYVKHIFSNVKWDSSDKELHDAVLRAPFRGLSKNRIMNFFILMRELLGKDAPADTLRERLKQPRALYVEIMDKTPNHKNVGRFTVRAFFKLLHLQGEYEFDKSLPAPLGQNVERAVEKLTGYKGSRKAFDELAQSIHKKFASLSDTDIYVINSGLWSLGEAGLMRLGLYR